MSFLKSYPATSILIAATVFAAVAGWMLWRWYNRPGTNRRKFARFFFVVGVVEIVIGLILTAMNLSPSLGHVNYQVFMGLITCWIAWVALRESPGTSPTSKAEPPSVPQR